MGRNASRIASRIAGWRRTTRAAWAFTCRMVRPWWTPISDWFASQQIAHRYSPRPKEQRTLAAICGLCLLWFAITWVGSGGHRGEWVRLASPDFERRPVRFLVDVNTASRREMTALPRIGPTLAGRIVESRERSGPFADVYALRRVRGIGPRTVQRLRPFTVTASDRSASQFVQR